MIMKKIGSRVGTGPTVLLCRSATAYGPVSFIEQLAKLQVGAPQRHRSSLRMAKDTPIRSKPMPVADPEFPKKRRKHII